MARLLRQVLSQGALGALGVYRVSVDLGFLQTVSATRASSLSRADVRRRSTCLCGVSLLGPNHSSRFWELPPQ